MTKIMKQILIVDDTPDNLDALRGILSPGYDVKVSISGEQALKVAQEQLPDLIMLDIVMPDMDGYEVCEKLKADSQTRKIPVIFITSKTDIEDETRGLSLGAVDYIHKPFSAPIILARVEAQVRLYTMVAELEKHNIALQEAAELQDDVERIRSLTESSIMLQDKLNRSMDLLLLETDSYTLDMQDIDLISVIVNITADLESLPQHGHKSKLFYINGETIQDPAGFMVSGDENLFHLMLTNLVRNAYEAAPHNSIIEFDLQQTDDMTRIQITNQGSVPDEIRGTLFDKYVTSGKFGGAGVGTHAARLCAIAQSGNIEVNHLPDDKTQIVVTLSR